MQQSSGTANTREKPSGMRGVTDILSCRGGFSAATMFNVHVPKKPTDHHTNPILFLEGGSISLCPIFTSFCSRFFGVRNRSSDWATHPHQAPHLVGHPTKEESRRRSCPPGVSPEQETSLPNAGETDNKQVSKLGVEGRYTAAVVMM